MTIARYAVCQRVLRGRNFSEIVGLTVKSGATGLGVMFDAVVEHGADEVRRMLDDNDLVASSLMGAIGPVLAGDDAEQVEPVRRAVEACAVLDAPGVVITTGALDDSSVNDADARCRRWFERVAPLAQASGVRILLEPIHPLLRWASYVHTLRHAIELTQQLPGTGLCLDTAHLWWDRDFTTDVVALCDEVFTVQVADIDANALREYRYARTQLGTGALPLEAMLTTLEDAGYRGLYENECVPPLPQGEQAAYVHRGGEWLGRLVRNSATGAR